MVTRRHRRSAEPGQGQPELRVDVIAHHTAYRPRRAITQKNAVRQEASDVAPPHEHSPQ
jgi:hypothetical protein